MENEDQQVEQIKAFIKDYGPWIVAGVVLGLGSLFGWRYYQDSQVEAAQARTAVYQQVIETLQFGEDQDALARAQAITSELSGSEQGALARLYLAQHAVSAGDLDTARSELETAHAELRHEDLKSIVAMRLARIDAALEDFTSAQAWLAGIRGSAFAAGVAEIQGDIYFAQGNYSAARESYLAAADASAAGANNALQMKIDNLAGHE
ncbi:tetratricopeptide repeat protein [Aliidiomarina halalkaliphila]|uniref:Tetratricopeptide repeat protein n=1 Tax=Aliidiomarina halalkaliphila TaxID=2593535 RepID=A0A552X5P4_9GAMM|nr:tetratricopeptide repeat protein [Aliidiomarina halalkaliphila]TRW50322.1 tetratricopeptide repeat protein [Aliidiomarina halalkaliphila]